MEGPEMTEMASKVYDLIYARPVLSLMELSSIAISIRLWRWKIRRHIKNKNLNKLHFLDDIPLQSILPKNTATPPVINRIVEKQVKNLQYSMLWWKITHNMDIFQLQHPFDYNFPLRNVNNFSYDYDGTVHWTRTAKRMMMCARFSEREKFKIACMYCFEDDIRRIWPSVSNELDSEKCVFGSLLDLEGPEMTEMTEMTEMSGISSKVYDLIYARPVMSLMELSSIAISIQLWRWKIRTQIKNKNFNKCWFYDGIPLQSILPENTPTPSVINRIVEKQVKNLRRSMSRWMLNHNTQIFRIHHPLNFCFPLKNVDNFSYDYDGTVHWVRTAKRMMTCARFNEREKFKIACMYCFEDDIRRIWPSLSNEPDLDKFLIFDIFPNLYYWIYCLRNEMHKIRILLENDEDIFEQMLDRCESKNWTPVEYFWSRVPSSRRFQKTLDLYDKHGRELFSRVVLPRLSKSELDRFVAEKGAELIAASLEDKKT
ncbi:uncharacterized protein LOC135839015 isoform X2 [Planococcus citri]|uniref:uncharacterized protein LOC135839015 isoform X2 n=1 Tax=Planococcus citri TaxID=170843 RepID=UPI0031F92E83